VEVAGKDIEEGGGKIGAVFVALTFGGEWGFPNCDAERTVQKGMKAPECKTRHNCSIVNKKGIVKTSPVAFGGGRPSERGKEGRTDTPWKPPKVKHPKGEKIGYFQKGKNS